MTDRFPAFELHCHLDGSVRVDTIAALAREQGIQLSGPPQQTAVVSPHASSLLDYLKAIDVALDVLQTPDALYRAARELVEDWSADQVMHGEARFAPKLHQRRGLRLPEVVDAVADGLADGMIATGIDAALILCCMRPSDPSVTWQVVEHAATNPRVVGVDIAGPENGVSLLPHAAAFRAAADAGLRITVHAGEADSAINIWQAIDDLGAERIGHGVKSTADAALMQRLATDQIYLELCPTSNVQTRAVDNLNHHPIEQFRAAGIPISLSTDARTVSRVTLRTEFHQLRETFGWNDATWNLVQLTAMKAAFTSSRSRSIRDSSA